ncbi:MAG: hypothetical protein WCK58_10610 [Chloroflexota bacterium]
MPVWRCPHCATPQAESSRCWVCRRSTTSCGTCRHFRRGVAGGLGLCGLDPRHLALNGTEMRACWTSTPAPSDPGGRRWASAHGRVPGDATGRAYAGGQAGATATASALALGGRRPRTFVPVDELGTAPVERPETEAQTPAPVTAVPGTWWLWGDPEPWPES